MNTLDNVKTINENLYNHTLQSLSVIAVVPFRRKENIEFKFGGQKILGEFRETFAKNLMWYEISNDPTEAINYSYQFPLNNGFEWRQ